MSPALTTLATHTYLNLETFKKDGTGVQTPVWFVIRDGAIYVFTDGSSFKVKRLRRNPKARIAGCNASGKSILTEWFDATGAILDAGPEVDAAYEALNEKYGWQMKLLTVGARISGSFKRRTMLKFQTA